MTDFAWVAPTNPDAETSLLGSILHDGGVFADARMVVTADDFYEPRCATLWRLLESLAAEGLPLDLVTVAPRAGAILSDGAGLAVTCMEAVMDGSKVAAYARIVAEYAQRRRIGMAALLMLKRAGDQRLEGRDAIAEAQAAAVEALRDSSSHRVMPVAEVVDRAREQADAAQERDTSLGLTTGWSDLDAVLGGMRAGDMIVVAARPSQGKSSLATSLLVNLAVIRSVPSLLVTLETSPEQTARNMACALAQVNAADVMAGKSSNDAFAAFGSALAQIRQAPMHILGDAVQASVLRGTLPRLVLRLGLRIAVIDYLQFLTPEKSGRDTTREREVATMSWHLKQAAKEAGIPLVVLCQLNRAVESRGDGIPRMSDLRDSGSIEQDADAIVMISTENTATSTTGVQIDKKILHVVKNRVGPTGDVPMHFERPWLRWGSFAPRFDLVFPDKKKSKSKGYRSFNDD